MKDKLLLALKSAWSDDTSYFPEEWHSDNASRGQCAVSSLIIQDYLGGEIIKCSVEGEDGSHFYNSLSDGVEIDATGQQFSHGVEFMNIEVVPRVAILNSKDTQRRYSILSKRVSEILR